MNCFISRQYTVYIFSPGMYPSINLQNIFVSVIATSGVGNAFITNSMISKYSSAFIYFYWGCKPILINRLFGLS